MSTVAFAATPDAPHGAPDPGVAFPPFDPSTFASQLFWLALSFGALYWIMSRVALPRMEQLLEARRARIAGDLAEAERMQSAAKASGDAYEKSLADARASSQTIARQQRETLNAEADAKRKAVESDLSTRLAAAERQVADTKTRAMANVDSIATEAAGAIVERLIGRTPSADALAQAVRGAKAG